MGLKSPLFYFPGSPISLDNNWLFLWHHTAPLPEFCLSLLLTNSLCYNFESQIRWSFFTEPGQIRDHLNPIYLGHYWVLLCNNRSMMWPRRDPQQAWCFSSAISNNWWLQCLLVKGFLVGVLVVVAGMVGCVQILCLVLCLRIFPGRAQDSNLPGSAFKALTTVLSQAPIYWSDFEGCFVAMKTFSCFYSHSLKWPQGTLRVFNDTWIIFFFRRAIRLPSWGWKDRNDDEWNYWQHYYWCVTWFQIFSRYAMI